MLKVSADLAHHFKGYCSSSSIIMLAVYLKLRFSLSYRDLEELMSIRGAVIGLVLDNVQKSEVWRCF